MPDLPNRDDFEARVARKLSSLMRRQMGNLLEVLGDPPRLENLPADYWDTVGVETAAVLRPELERIYVESAKEVLTSNPIGVNWGQINEGAARWAETHVSELVGQLNGTTQKLVQQKIAGFFREGMTIGELRDSLTSALGPVRAELIATTEVTRAAVEGQLEWARQMESENGVRLVPIWQTSNDEIVCPICEPRNQTVITDGQYPPIHSRCRCWVDHEIPETVTP